MLSFERDIMEKLIESRGFNWAQGLGDGGVIQGVLSFTGQVLT